MNYIYALVDPRDNAVRYVGKTCRPRRRYSDHLTEKYKFHRIHWVQSLLAVGLKPQMTILEAIPDDVNWEDREIFWIKHYRDMGCNLTNGTDGGDHPPSGKGEKRPKSESWHKHIADFLSVHNRSAKMREVSRKVGLENKGKKRTAETRARQSAARKGKKIHTPLSIQKLIERNRITKHDPQIMRDAMRKLWDDPIKGAEMRAALIERNKNRNRH